MTHDKWHKNTTWSQYKRIFMRMKPCFHVIVTVLPVASKFSSDKNDASDWSDWVVSVRFPYGFHTSRCTDRRCDRWSFEQFFPLKQSRSLKVASSLGAIGTRLTIIWEPGLKCLWHEKIDVYLIALFESALKVDSEHVWIFSAPLTILKIFN